MTQRNTKTAELPLVYACSGCSNVAQLANRVAVSLNRERLAEMSCISGVGGGVDALVRVARSGRTIIAIDGCHLHCSKACLARANVTADHHITLSGIGLRKRYDAECGEEEFRLAREYIAMTIVQGNGQSAPATATAERPPVAHG